MSDGSDLQLRFLGATGTGTGSRYLDQSRLDLARTLGVELCINSAEVDPVAALHRESRGAHGVLVTAVSRESFAQSLGMLHKRGTMSMVGLPPGDFALPIFDVVLNAKTVRGSIVGTRQDLAEALQFAAEGVVHASTTSHRLEHINHILDELRNGRIDGRAVLSFE